MTSISPWLTLTISLSSDLSKDSPPGFLAPLLKTGTTNRGFGLFDPPEIARPIVGNRPGVAQEIRQPNRRANIVRHRDILS